MNKPHLILLPGWGMEPCVWSPIQDKLSHQFNMSFVDWRGISSLACFKEKVIKLIKSKDLTSFSLLGWSLGSLVALDIAIEYPLYVKNLILIGGTSCFITHDDYKHGWPQRVVERMKHQLQKYKEKTLGNFYESMFSTYEKTEQYDKHFPQLISEMNLDEKNFSLLIGLDYLIQMDFRHQLKNIKKPCLLIHGEEDQICPLSASEYISNRIAGKVVLKVLPNTGHVPFITNPDICTDYIKRFMEDGLQSD